MPRNRHSRADRAQPGRFVLLAAVLLVIAAAVRAAAPSLADSFRAVCAAKSAAAEKTDALAVSGEDGWLFLTAELRHLGVGKFWGADAATVSRAARPESADPLPAILDFKQQLDRAGIELLLVPAPPKAVLYPDKLARDLAMNTATAPPRLDPFHQEFYAALRRNKIHVLDLTPDLLAHRFDANTGTAYCKTDSHWSGQACILAAKRIAADVENRPWMKRLPKLALTQEQRAVRITGDLASAESADAAGTETLTLRFVGTRKNGALELVEPRRDSPVVLLGDSHNLIFHAGGDMLARGAGLPDQLAFSLGVPVDLVAVRGSGATPARVNLLRLARANPKYLAGKKLVLWCFSAREFTESSGWSKVPIVENGR